RQALQLLRPDQSQQQDAQQQARHHLRQQGRQQSGHVPVLQAAGQVRRQRRAALLDLPHRPYQAGEQQRAGDGHHQLHRRGERGQHRGHRQYQGAQQVPQGAQRAQGQRSPLQQGETAQQPFRAGRSRQPANHV